MSKSEKNFITIKEALKKFTGRQMRFLYLLHKWDTSFNYTETSFPEAVEKERQFYNFFLNIKVELRNNSIKSLQK